VYFLFLFSLSSSFRHIIVQHEISFNKKRMMSHHENKCLKLMKIEDEFFFLLVLKSRFDSMNIVSKLVPLTWIHFCNRLAMSCYYSIFGQQQKNSKSANIWWWESRSTSDHTFLWLYIYLSSLLQSFLCFFGAFIVK